MRLFLVLITLFTSSLIHADSRGWLLEPKTEDARFERLQTYLGGFSSAMRETGQRYDSIYDALSRDNPELARYHWSKIRQTIEQGIIKRPARAANAKAILLDTTWAQVDTAFASGNPAIAWQGYEQAKAACMACHVAEKVSFMNQQPVFERAVPDLAADCKAKGGQWIKVGRAQTPMCDIPYNDAGKACSDSDQCQGSCISQERQRGKKTKGQCSASPAATFGCYALVSKGVSRGMICVD